MLDNATMTSLRALKLVGFADGLAEWVFRPIVTGDFGIVTGRFGLS